MSPTSHLSPTTKRVLRRAQLFMTAVDVVIFGLSCASALLFVLGLSNAGYYENWMLDEIPFAAALTGVVYGFTLDTWILASTIVLWAKPSSRFRSPLAESIIWGFWAFIGLGCMGVASMIWSAVKKCLENNYADRMPESACNLGTIGAPLGWVAVGLLLIRFAYCLWQVTFQLSARQNRLGQLDLAVSRTETGDDTHGLNVYSKSDI